MTMKDGMPSLKPRDQTVSQPAAWASVPGQIAKVVNPLEPLSILWSQCNPKQSVGLSSEVELQRRSRTPLS